MCCTILQQTGDAGLLEIGQWLIVFACSDFYSLALPSYDKLCIAIAFPSSRKACLRSALKPIRWPIAALPSLV